MTDLAGSAPAEVRLWRADHAGPAYDQDIADSRAAVGDQAGLDYLAHVTYGILDFALGVPARWPKGDDLTLGLENAVRQLGLAVVQLDEACEPLDSGALIRVVLQGEHGALLQLLKVAGQSFFGVTFDGAAVTVGGVDARLAALAAASAARIGGPTLDWGGFRDREHSGELLLPSLVSPVPADSGTAAISVGQHGAVPDPVTDACRRALHPGNLHYVAIYHRHELLWSADLFDTAELAPHFQRVSPDARRRGYVRLLHQVDLQFLRFGRLLALVGSEHLVRLVLDVARGAIYLLPLADDDLLVAVTLIQSQVDEADRKARALHAIIGGSWPKTGLPGGAYAVSHPARPIRLS